VARPAEPAAPQAAASQVRQFLGASALYVPSVVVPACANFLFIVVFTRLLGPEELGRYFLIVAGVTFSAVGAGAWFQQAILRFDSGLDEAAASGRVVLYVQFLVLASVALGLVAAVAIGVGGVSGRWAPAFLALVFALVVADVWYRTLLAALQARAAAGAYAIASVVMALGRYSTAGLLFLLGLRSHLSLLIGLLVTGIGVVLAVLLRLGSAVGLARLARAVGGWSPPLSVDFGRYASYGMPMLGFMLASEARPLLDRVIITAHAGEGSVGIYASNYAIGVSSVGLLALPMLLAAHPILMGMANAANPDAEGFHRANAAFMRIFLVVMTPIALIAVPNAATVARLAVGPEYVAGHPVIALGFVGSVVNGLALYVGKTLEWHRRTRTLLLLNVASLVVTTGFNVVAVGRVGYVGAGYGYCVGAVVYLALVWVAARRDRGVTVPWRLAASGVAAVLVATLIAALAPSRLGEVAGGVAGTGAGSLIALPVLLVTLGRSGETRAMGRAVLRRVASLVNAMSQ